MNALPEGNATLLHFLHHLKAHTLPFACQMTK